jgi:hypothetical protein
VAAGLIVGLGSTGASSGDDETLRQLDVYLGTSGPVQASSQPTTGDDAHTRLFRDFIRARMQQRSFYEAVLPRLFDFLTEPVQPPVAYTLQQGKLGGRDYFYLDDKQCTAKDMVRVNPWWSPREPVWICKDAYRPDVTVDSTYATGAPFCEGTRAVHDGSPCRCGPSLWNCAKDDAQATALAKATADEVTRTMEYVIRDHRRFSTVLTMGDTVRSGLGDFVYARNRAFHTGKLALDPAVEATTPRPRDPEFAGGLLTMPFTLWLTDSARRIVVARLWEDFLCTPLLSTAVHADQLFQLSDPSLRAHAHMELTTKIGCKDCHARIENILQATSSFPSFAGMRFRPEAGFAGTSNFFVRDSTDLRGTGPSTPLWVGEMIGKQPEFAGCMVTKVETLFYGDDPVPGQLHQSWLHAFEQTEDMATLIENVVVGRFASASPAPLRASQR